VPREQPRTRWLFPNQPPAGRYVMPQWLVAIAPVSQGSMGGGHSACGQCSQPTTQDSTRFTGLSKNHRSSGILLTITTATPHKLMIFIMSTITMSFLVCVRAKPRLPHKHNKPNNYLPLSKDMQSSQCIVAISITVRMITTNSHIIATIKT
jgi:hypothetical protein